MPPRSVILEDLTEIPWDEPIGSAPNPGAGLKRSWSVSPLISGIVPSSARTEIASGVVTGFSGLPP